ncbi:MAG: prepilin-type N-terminal cleavage/methylation domain-containing protein [Desulfobacteraceae bacterium]|nr:MAG: prepilin-type N-terminal cleavage/methylation domain-containing protein [Desulfobacteraceae bacterium]
MRRSTHNMILPSGSDGFSLIELLAVLVIISVTSAFVWSRFGGNAKADLNARTDTIKAHLRYAQVRAMDSNRIWGIRYTGSGYSLFSYDGSAESVSRLPDEEDAVVDLSGSGIGLGSFSVVSFDSWGRPFNNATATGVSIGQTITVFDGSNPANQIIITRNTGFIP